MTLLYFTHPTAAAHDPGPGHPEAPIRMRAIEAAVAAADLPVGKRVDLHVAAQARLVQESAGQAVIEVMAVVRDLVGEVGDLRFE